MKILRGPRDAVNAEEVSLKYKGSCSVISVPYVLITAIAPYCLRQFSPIHFPDNMQVKCRQLHDEDIRTSNPKIVSIYQFRAFHPAERARERQFLSNPPKDEFYPSTK